MTTDFSSFSYPSRICIDFSEQEIASCNYARILCLFDPRPRGRRSTARLFAQSVVFFLPDSVAEKKDQTPGESQAFRAFSIGFLKAFPGFSFFIDWTADEAFHLLVLSSLPVLRIGRRTKSHGHCASYVFRTQDLHDWLEQEMEAVRAYGRLARFSAAQMTHIEHTIRTAFSRNSDLDPLS